MAKEKIYKCCICHKIMDDKKPIRLVKQEYGNEGRRAYNQYYNVATYDFCERCFKPFEKYIDKYKED